MSATGNNASQLALDGVGKRYHLKGNDIVALHGINLRFAPGEFVSIVGGSGCGKSTLLRIIGGLERDFDGSVRLNGSPIAGPGLDRGLLFQDHRLLPWLTVWENIAFALAESRSAAARRVIAEHIALVGLKGFEKAYPHQLSGGMAQRASIARALVNRPQILLLDEPFGALDALTRIQLQKEILRIWQAERTTMVLVTHDIDEAIFLGDRVVVMSNRPGTIKKEVRIELARPRPRNSPSFADFRQTVYREFFTETELAPDYMV
ncbi:MAG: ABC transporter ATP-binding protein [Chthoniobacteraceae bacterium]|nr:ABC transporter ATP-binding protein [Chthoniobacteraceae bacterium]